MNLIMVHIFLVYGYNHGDVCDCTVIAVKCRVFSSQSFYSDYSIAAFTYKCDGHMSTIYDKLLLCLFNIYISMKRKPSRTCFCCWVFFLVMLCNMLYSLLIPMHYQTSSSSLRLILPVLLVKIQLLNYVSKNSLLFIQ